MTNDIRVIDKFLSDNDFNYVIDYCRKALYGYGELDTDSLPSNLYPNQNIDNYVTGMVHQIFPINPYSEYSTDSYPDEKIFDIMHGKCISQFPFLEKLALDSVYINCFAPGEKPYFHIDTPEGISQSYTCLYYANQNWDLNQGGETQFYMNNGIYGILPIPNRMVIFDGSIQHRATSFRNYHRFTIAVKYFNIDDVPDSEVAQ